MDDLKAIEHVSDRILTIPNALSLLRLVLVPVFVWAILAHHDLTALLILMAAGFSDYLDGKLARRWGQVSRVGQLLDPAADRLYILATLVCLGVRDLIPWWIVGILVLRDLVLALTLPLLSRKGYGPLPVTYLGKAATFNLLYAFPLLLLSDINGLTGQVASAFGWAFAWWGVGLYWWSGIAYLRQVRQVLRG